MRRFNARPLVVLSFFVAFVSAPVFAIDRNIQDKESYQPKASVTATNGILTVSMDDTSGAFTIRTGASHPQPNQNVFFPCCTSYLTVRDATASQMLVTPNAVGVAPGLTGYTTVSMGAPVVTALGTTGFRATFTTASWTIVEDVVINGTSLSDTNVRQSVSVTNTTGSPRQFGVRYMWDWEIDSNDGSFFRTRNPDGTFTNTPTTFNAPTFQLYEEVNNITSPLFSVFATVTGGSLTPAPTTPDQFRYSNWPSSVGSAWDYTDPATTGDSSVSYFWGFTAPITLAAGATSSFNQYVTTQLSAIGGGPTTPVQSVVPTLSTWGMLLLIGLLAAFAAWSARRRVR